MFGVTMCNRGNGEKQRLRVTGVVVVGVRRIRRSVIRKVLLSENIQNTFIRGVRRFSGKAKKLEYLRERLGLACEQRLVMLEELVEVRVGG